MASPRPHWVNMLDAYQKLKNQPSSHLRLELEEKQAIAHFASCKILGNFTFLTISFAIDRSREISCAFYRADGIKFYAKPLRRFSLKENCIQFCVNEVKNHEDELTHYLLEVARIYDKKEGVSYHNGFERTEKKRSKKRDAPSNTPSYEASSEESLPPKKQKYFNLRAELAQRDLAIQELKTELAQVRLEIAQLASQERIQYLIVD